MTTATRWLRPEPFRNPWRGVAVALLPLMILGLLISALWNPQERLDTVKAAIVNLDEPVEVDGQTVPLGRQLAAGLVSGGETAGAAVGESAAVPASDASYDWEIADEAGAADGLADGTYAAVVTIPEDFSAAATSFGGEDPAKARQATIDVATPANGRVLDDALAQVVAQTATGVLGSTLTETYVDNVLVGFSTLSEELGKAADGADQLADGATDAGKGAEELASGAGDLADGATEAGEGAEELAVGAHQTAAGVAGVGDGVASLAGGAGQWASGANQWAAGADQAAAGVSQLADGAGRSADGAADLAAGADQLATGTQGVASGAKDLAGGLAETAKKSQQLPGSASELASGATEVSGGVDKLVAGIEKACADPLSAPFYAEFCVQLPQLRELRAGAAKVAEGSAGLAGQGGAKPTGLYELSAGISGLADGAGHVAGGAEQVSGGASALADGAHQLSGGLNELEAGADRAAGGVTELSAGARELSDGAGGLASGATELANGAGRLATGTSQLATGVDGLADGVGELGTGTRQLATGVDGLAGGVGELAGGAKDLSDGLGQATAEIPTYTEQERQSLASVVADPVSTDGEVTDLDTGATGPMFAVLALWLGALALMIVFPPVPLHARGSTRGALRLTLGTFGFPAAIALVTGLATGAVLAGIESLDVGGWVATMGFGALVSVAFVAVNQALAAALGHVGRGLSLLVAVLVIATGVVSTVPGVLESLAAFLPVGAGLDGLVGLIEPGVGGVGTAIAAMVLWGIAGLAVTTIVVARQRTVRASELLRTARLRTA